jgi:signal transducing adaptor molecule
MSAATPQKESYPVRALYDFEAAEDNELTFKTGEIIVVLDDTDQNWWKGSNHRGDGLFPSNFVSPDLNAQPEPTVVERRTVQFNEDVEVKIMEREPEPVEIDEEKIDKLMHLLHEADPSGEKGDSEEVLHLEDQCQPIAPLIDSQLELIDRRHAALSGANQQLMEAMNLYHNLMKESLQMPYYTGPYPPSTFPVAPQFNGQVHPGQQIPQQIPNNYQQYPVGSNASGPGAPVSGYPNQNNQNYVPTSSQVGPIPYPPGHYQMPGQGPPQQMHIAQPPQQPPYGYYQQQGPPIQHHQQGPVSSETVNYGPGQPVYDGQIASQAPKAM